MATRKNKAEEVEAKMEEYQVELHEEPEEIGGEEQVTMSLDDLRRLIAEEVRKAKEEAPAAKAAVKPAKKKFIPAKPAKKVKIRLFKDNGRYAKPVFVAVNGHKFIVPRGVDVEVPEYIAKVLDESFRQDMATADQLMELERKFSEDTRKLK